MSIHQSLDYKLSKTLQSRFGSDCKKFVYQFIPQPEESFISVSENVSVADAPRKTTKSMPKQPANVVPVKSEQFKTFQESLREEKIQGLNHQSGPNQNNSFKADKPIEKMEKLYEKFDKALVLDKASEKVDKYDKFHKLEKKYSLKALENEPKGSFGNISKDLNLSKELIDQKLLTSTTLSPKNTNFSTLNPSMSQKQSISSAQDDIMSLSPSKVHLKKGYNIPNLNLNKMATDKNLSYTERNNSSASIGFRSERSLYKTDLDQNFHTEPNEKSKDKGDNGINFFFYKNFNKFIQNLYIQDEQMIKKKLNDKKTAEKFMNNPYKKEIESNINRKSLGMGPGSGNTKKPATSSQNRSTFVTKPSTADSSSSKRVSTLEDEKKSSLPPKNKDDITANLLKESTQVNATKSLKSLKPFSYKSIPHLDVGKFRYESLEAKTFYTPREKNQFELF